MKKYNLVITLFLISHTLFGQNYQEEFAKLCETGDTLSQKKLLQKWESESPLDPELYTSYFNYYYQKSIMEVITFDEEPNSSESLELIDSLNQTSGYMNSTILLSEDFLTKGFGYIDKGIEMFPTRLDMRFGKIYLLGKNQDWQKFTKEIIRSIEYSNQINNQWIWTNNELVEDGQNFFLASIQDYQVQLYNTGEDILLVNMREIAEKILDFYPNHIESLSNISVTYLITGEYDKSLVVLLKAEELNPKDQIILNNIAQAYKLKEDKQNAIKYYKKVIEHGDDHDKEYARNQIEELKN